MENTLYRGAKRHRAGLRRVTSKPHLYCAALTPVLGGDRGEWLLQKWWAYELGEAGGSKEMHVCVQTWPDPKQSPTTCL